MDSQFFAIAGAHISAFGCARAWRDDVFRGTDGLLRNHQKMLNGMNMLCGVAAFPLQMIFLVWGGTEGGMVGWCLGQRASPGGMGFGGVVFKLIMSRKQCIPISALLVLGGPACCFGLKESPGNRFGRGLWGHRPHSFCIGTGLNGLSSFSARGTDAVNHCDQFFLTGVAVKWSDVAWIHIFCNCWCTHQCLWPCKSLERRHLLWHRWASTESSQNVEWDEQASVESPHFPCKCFPQFWEGRRDGGSERVSNGEMEGRWGGAWTWTLGNSQFKRPHHEVCQLHFFGNLLQLDLHLFQLFVQLVCVCTFLCKHSFLLSQLLLHGHEVFFLGSEWCIFGGGG